MRAADGAPAVIDVLVVDDHALMRDGLRGVVSAAEDMRVVGLAADGAQALELIATAAPHIVLMDLSMPRMDGLTAIRHISEHYPDVGVVVLTSYADHQRVLDAMDAGAIGYMLKDTDPAGLLAVIRAAVAGHAPLDPRAARALLHTPRAAVPAAELTDRERVVLEFVRQGLANNQIARALGIREGKVKAYLTSVFHRIGVRDRTSAALWARTNLPTDTENSG